MRSIGVALRRWCWRAAGWIAVIALLVWAWDWVTQAAVQLFLSLLVTLCALPLMKRLEKRFSPGLSAGLSLLALAAAGSAALLLLVPPLIRQSRELAALLPDLLNGIKAWAARGQSWLRRSGMPVEGAIQEMLLSRGEEALGAAAPALVKWAGGLAGSVGQWLLAPVFAFYFLRDRRRITRWLLVLVPVRYRRKVVRILREMRRETAGYLRGQLMISAAVGGLTATGLLFCGIPAWMVLGVLMGVLEMIPYAGPILGGTFAVLFALPQGTERMLWALVVVIAVQQLEGSLLSPRFISGATRLHPVVILLCVTIGGAACGVTGVLLAAPLLLCLRAALRVLAEIDIQKCESSASMR